MESRLGNHDMVFVLGDSTIFHSKKRGILMSKSYECDDMGTLLAMYNKEMWFI